MSLKIGLICGVTLGLMSGCGSSGAASGSSPGAVENDAGAPATGVSSVDGGGADADLEVACAVTAAAEANVVVTLRGALRGKTNAGDASVSFLGIPYAEPPTGALRFRAPLSHACWSGVKDALAYGSECAQAALTGGATGDEDCLSLNVWVPSASLPATGKTSGALPVLFFIHGGAEIAGGSNQTLGTGNLYDGQALAEREHAVVVTTNYRLGSLGFLAHSALDAENPAGRRSGNYGILDLVSSLTWVKKNIASFGGDASHVMIFGESAGALNTCVLVASPLAAGLFSSALMESGGCAAPTTASRETAGNALSTKVGCANEPDVAACLRGKSAADLVNGSAGLTDLLASDLLHTWDMPYGPSVDGYVLTEEPMSAFKSGHYNHQPFAIGSNANEMELFITPGSVNTCSDYESMVKTRLGPLATQALTLYPCTSYLLPRMAIVALATDAAFTCGARRIARAVASSPSAPPVFRYYYTHVRDYGPMAALRAAHTAELPFVFQTWSSTEAYVATPAESALSDSMEGYWARLGATGDPNGGGALPWTAYQPANDNVIVFDDAISTTSAVNSAKCDFWDSVTM